MTNVTALPYITAPDETWVAGPWFAALGDDPPVPVTDFVASWDYAARLGLTCEISIDVDLLRSAVRIAGDTVVELIVIVDCAAMNERWIAFRSELPPSGGANVRCSFSLPPGTIAEKVTLERQVVLSKDRAVPPPLPARSGSILLRDAAAQSISLEGATGRFPVQLIDMAAIGYPDALWVLDLDTSDADRSFLAAARLYVNSEHPAKNELLDGGSDRGRDLTSAMQWDILRQLVMRSALSGLTVGPDQEPESLGRVLWALIHEQLGYDSLAEIAAAMEAAPDELEARIQSCTGLFR